MIRHTFAHVCLVSALLTSVLFGQVTQLVSITTGGSPGGLPYWESKISDSGRFVVFSSTATSLVPGDINGCSDVFLRDRQLGVTELCSIGASGVQGNGNSDSGYLSRDGEIVVFASLADNLVPGDSNGCYDVFIRDRTIGTTQRVSVGMGGSQADAPSASGPTTPDGQYVLIVSAASNLTSGASNGNMQVYLRDLQAATNELISVNAQGIAGNGWSYGPTVSADARYVAFISESSNLVPSDTNGERDVFVRDRQMGTIERVNLGPGGAQSEFTAGGDLEANISADGRYVSFITAASNLVAGDTNGIVDVFVRDRVLGNTERVSIAVGGGEANGNCYSPWISRSGRVTCFKSVATNLVVGDNNGASDVFAWHRSTGTMELLSADPFGNIGNGDSGGTVHGSDDAQCITFVSDASNFVPSDSLGTWDVFVRERSGGPEFQSVCHPGVDGVATCPCLNPPLGVESGCNNSAGTGGAVLGAGGGTYLSSDSLFFTTVGECHGALSVVTQWSAGNSSGIVYGMGIRCTLGSVKRLYTKQASGGSITAPDFAAGDVQVSMRSAALGDQILAGQSRWYFVYYRDPNVLGGCPATSTFNCTQTGQVTWSP